MKLIGLTGGIGSGKSTVSARLAERGAIIVDADAITRELQEPGRPVFAELVVRFGTAIVGADGRLDRPALAAIAFADPDRLKELNSIVHPAVGVAMAAQIESAVGSDRVVILDVPLLAENPRQGLLGTIVVDTPVDVAVERLVAHRGFSADDARSRMARQATREDRLKIATWIIDNGGGVQALDAQIEALWATISTLPHTTDDELTAYRTGVRK